MKTKMLLLAALVSQTAQAELFISEYVKGSSNNKAIEIFNPSDSAVDLSSYRLKMYHNGSATPTSGKDFQLKGTIAAKGTLVLTDSAAAPALLKLDSYYVEGQTNPKNGFIGTGNFNGDDAIALFKNNTLIDVFGQIGFDPGSGWTSGNNTTANATMVRKASIGQGDSNGSDTFDPALEWDFYPADDFSNLGKHTSTGTGGGGGGETPDPEIPPAGNCGDRATFISAVQGSGAVSPLVGSTLTVEAVVTRVMPHASGFFVQEEAADQDNNPATSEAVFVFNDTASDYPQVGQKVRVTGKVEEYFTKTQLRRSGLSLCGNGAAIDAVILNLPVSSLSQWEALEGMLVSLPQQLVVSDHYNLGRYGELTVAPQQLFIPTNLYRPGSPEAVTLADLNRRSQLVLDDLVSAQNPALIKFPSPGLSASNTVRLGDGVSNLSGVIDYSFNLWRLLPDLPVQFSHTPRPTTPELPQKGSLVVAGANVLNYFNGNGNGGGFPTPRGATTALEFDRQAAKTVDAFAAMNADVIGLMEIENDGYGSSSAIADLVNRLNARLGANTYAYIRPAGLSQLGTDEITVGLIYKPAKVTPVGSTATTNSGVFSTGNRQPLAQSFRENSNDEVFTVVVNHFKSKGGSGSGADADQGDGQGAWNALRVKAANELTAWLAKAPTGVSDPDVLIIGDLNAYAKEDPIMALRDGGFVDLIEQFQQNRGYSYLFEGEVGYLDHALASATLASQVSYAVQYHINASEPRVLDYNTEFKSQQQVTDLFLPDQYRSSDHDPVLIELALNSFHPADLDKDGDVDNNDITLFTRLLQSGQASLAHDFNKDGLVNVADARAMTAWCTRSRCATK